MAALLEMLGVPRSAMWFEPDSRNTYESAVSCKTILQAKGIHRIILVTSASHMPRSVGLFEHQGFEVIPAPTDFVVTRLTWDEFVKGGPASWVMQLLPSVDDLATTTRMLKEYFGIFIYRMRGEL